MTLVLLKEGRRLDTFQFEGEERVLVGRGEECDVRIDNLSVSRKHCELLLKDGFHLVSDLGSSNGTFVNGRRVSEANLNSGDRLTVGEFTLDYTAHFVPESPKVMLSKGLGELTIQVDPNAKREGKAPPPRRVTTKVRGHLTLIDDHDRNVLLQKTVFLVGSGPEADIPLEGMLAPRLAALILRERFGFRIIDVSPRGNQVTLNGVPTKNAALETGVEVKVGALRFRFYKGLPNVDEGTAVFRSRAVTRRLHRPR